MKPYHSTKKKNGACVFWAPVFLAGKLNFFQTAVTEKNHEL